MSHPAERALIHFFAIIAHFLDVIAQLVNFEILAVVSRTFNKYPYLH